VDRDYDRRRFARAASPVDDGGDCQNCRLPEGEGVRHRTLKDFAFHVVGTEEEGRELDRSVAQVALSNARAAGSWRTIVAPPREHRSLSQAGPVVDELIGRTLDGPPYNLVLHTAPLRERVDTTFHWHWELHPRLREVAGLELGTGLPVNPIAPEEAVEELLATLAPAVSAGRSGG